MTEIALRPGEGFVRFGLVRRFGTASRIPILGGLAALLLAGAARGQVPGVPQAPFGQQQPSAPLNLGIHEGTEQSVFGEVVDIESFLVRGERGSLHRKKGQAAADRGAPLGLYNPFNNEIVLPLAKGGESANRLLRPYVGEVVKVTGVMYDRLGGVRGLVLKKVERPTQEELFYSQYITSIAGLDMSELTEKERNVAIKVLNEQLCPSGAGTLTIARHLQGEPNCPVCLPMARGIIDAIHKGKSEKDVVANLASFVPATPQPQPQGGGGGPPGAAPPPPGQRVQVALGDAAVEGPKEAKVTIVEFTDFQ